MNVQEEYDIGDINSSFDFRGFLFKVLSHWPLFLISIAIGFGIAYYINVRKLNVYSTSNLVSIKDNQNPFFTTTTSLTFNWGGTTDKVNTVLIDLRTRKHNAQVVEQLQYYINYEKDGEYQREDVYGVAPFKVTVDTSAYQLFQKDMVFTTKTDTTFNIKVDFDNLSEIPMYHYGRKIDSLITLDKSSFERDFKFGQTIRLPFFEGVVERTRKPLNTQTPYYVNLTSIDAVTSKYTGIRVAPESNGSSVLKLTLSGTNKARLVDYLNKTVSVLQVNLLEEKNQFATNTISFIEDRLREQGSQLETVEDELNAYRTRNAIVDIDAENSDLSTKTAGLDTRKYDLERQIEYLQTLDQYLRTRTDYNSVPAPSVAGITEGSIVGFVTKIISLAEERSRYQYAYKENNPIFADIDRQIDATKSVLFENINSSQSLLNSELGRVTNELAGYEAKIQRLPREQQDLLKIQRRYDLNEQSYNLFLSKLNEARLVKAANVGDLSIVDKAKISNVVKVGPNTRLNYVLALLFGGLLPLIIVFLKVFFDNTIHTTDELEKLSKVPVLGVITRNKSKGNLVVLDKPRSAMSESFRALRSSLQYIYKKQGVEGAKTVLVTSSVAGEGKTFCSMNIASVFALSEKRTVLIGLDLRKPKIFDDFEINNAVGVVNYLIKDKSLSEITQKTSLSHLDIITSGPIPPNPSELLMKETMRELMTELEASYDYIIIDSAPIGLVADSLSLATYADAIIYIVKQGVTKKAMLSILNSKYKSGELKNVSLVLNYFQQKARYGYGYGYGNYQDSYHIDNTKKPWYKRLFSKS